MEKVVYGEWDQEGEFADSSGMEPHGAHQEQTSCPGYLKPTLTLILHPISQGRVPPRRPTMCLSLRSWFVVGRQARSLNAAGTVPVAPRRQHRLG